MAQMQSPEVVRPTLENDGTDTVVGVFAIHPRSCADVVSYHQPGLRRQSWCPLLPRSYGLLVNVPVPLIKLVWLSSISRCGSSPNQNYNQEQYRGWNMDHSEQPSCNFVNWNNKDEHIGNNLLFHPCVFFGWILLNQTTFSCMRNFRNFRNF